MVLIVASGWTSATTGDIGFTLIDGNDDVIMPLGLILIRSSHIARES